jgi:hypothetical protein
MENALQFMRDILGKMSCGVGTKISVKGIGDNKIIFQVSRDDGSSEEYRMDATGDVHMEWHEHPRRVAP